MDITLMNIHSVSGRKWKKQVLYFFLRQENVVVLMLTRWVKLAIIGQPPMIWIITYIICGSTTIQFKLECARGVVVQLCDWCKMLIDLLMLK